MNYRLCISAVLLALAQCCAWAADEYVPMAPDYGNSMMWHTTDGDTAGTGADVFYVVSTWETDWTTSDGQICHSADVWNVEHRRRMGIEMRRAAAHGCP